jgi:1-acyl-sn-glycerol-3-phosphate acyltransferase
MKSLGTVLRTISYGLMMAVVVIVAGIPTIIFSSLPHRIRIKCSFFYTIEHFFYWLLIKSWFVPLTIVGRENIPNKPVIFAANHASSIDIPLLGFVADGRPRLWFAWSALTKYPLLGYLIKRMAILVDTSSPRRAVQALHEASERVRGTQSSVMIFPEGGRFTDGRVHDFFRGFAILAHETQRPVIPVFIENAAKVCAPFSIWINYAPLRIVIGPEFSYLEGESDEQFLARVYAWFVSQTT